MRNRLLIATILLLPLFALSQTHTYFFDAVNGNDGNTAAQAQTTAGAWKTLTRLNTFMTSLVAGDVVRFRRGQTFPGFIIANKAGTSVQNIRFATWDVGAKPIITGLTDLTTWTNLGSNIWETTNAITTNTVVTNIVTVNGVNTAMGRTPNAGSFLTINNHTGHTSATINSLTGTPNYVGAELIARMAAAWIYARNLITNQATTVLTTVSNFPNPAGFTIYDYSNGQAFIQNSVSTLDQQNEWFYNTSTKKLRMFSVGTPTGVKIATSDSLVRISAGFLTFDSLDFRGANTDCFQLTGATNITISNCDIRYCGDMGVQQNDNNPNLTVLNSTFRDIENSGISDVFRSGNNGRNFTNNSFVNMNMVLGQMGSLDGQNMAICSQNNNGANDLFQNNTIDSCGYIGIFTMGQSYTVQNNFINHFCAFNSDGGAIYTGNHGTARNIISNICINGLTGLAQGIYVDDNGSNVNIINNSCSVGNIGLYMHNAHEITVRGNTVYGFSGANLVMGHDANDPIRNVTIRKNILVLNANVSQGNASYQTSEASQTNFGTSDSNNISKPVATDDNAWYTVPNGASFNHYTLAQWQAVSAQDLHSTRSPLQTTLANIRFVYNASNNVSVQALGANYLQILAPPNTTTQWNGSITLQPWTSAVLLQNGTGPPPLTATSSVAQNPLTCFGQTTSVTLNASGGTAPYQYRVGAGSFSSTNVFTGLAAGTYAFQVRDAALTVFSLNVTINQPSQITITQSSGTIAINGGSTTTTVTASGGTGTLQYKLDAGSFQSSNVFTGVTAGTHTITVRDANLCTNTLTYTLTQPSVLSVSAAATTNPLTCFGNTTTITVTASGATPPYQYQLNGGSFQSSNLFTGQGAGTYTITARDAAGALATTTLNITQPTQITITESHTAILVNGGTSTVTITASGGTGTKNYSLDGGTFQSSNVFAGVLAGNHSVVVRDANLCTNTISFTITQPSSLNVSASATINPLLCFGNTTTITVTASGGTTPYQYSINGGTFGSSNTFTNRGAGTYTLTVRDAALVTQTTTVTITQPTQIAITESHTAIAVNGGTSTVTITASGGTGTKNYSIDGSSFQASNIFAGVLAGNHTITVRDANLCTNTLTFTITQPTALLVSSSVTTAIACNGGSGVITVTASGGTSPYQYRISTGSFSSVNTFTVTAGTYQFFVQDAGGAIASVTQTITQPTIIAVNVSVSGAAPATVTVTASGGVGSLQYRLDAGSFQSSNVFTGVSAGNHTVTVRDANACTQARTFNVGTPLTFNLVVGTILCNGGTTTVAVNATGGTPPYNGTGTFTRAAGTWTFTVNDVTGATADTTITIIQPAIMAVSEGHTAIIVNGGTSTVTITATGGTGSKTYSLDGGSFQSSNVFAGVSAGNHSVIVKDANNCQAPLSFTITQPSNLNIGIVVGTAIACNGGTTTVTVSGTGGTTPYTYGKNGTFQSSTSFTAITAGTYTFSVKDAFTNQHDTIITITQPSALTLSVVTGTISVNGGNTTVDGTGTGGTGGLTYSLDGAGFVGSGHFTGVLAGSHTLRVKDANACITTNTFSISQPDNLIITISRGAAATCYGGTQNITVGATGGTTPYTGTGLQAKLAGTYTFTVTDAFGAVADTIITVTAPTQIAINVVTGTILVNGGTTTVTATASGGTSSLTYQLDGGSFQGTGSFSGVGAGQHTVTVKDANNCTNVNSFSISQPGVLFITATPTASLLDCYADETTVTVSGSGGTTPLTYGKNGVFQGSGTFNNIAAGTYTFSVKDAFNAQHDTVLTITQPPLISLLQITQFPNPIASYGGNADSVVITNAGGTPINDTVYEYSLDGGSFVQSDSAFKYVYYGISGGSHTVTIRDDNGCTQTYTFFINQPPAPLPYMIRSKRKKHIYQQL